MGFSRATAETEFAAVLTGDLRQSRKIDASALQTAMSCIQAAAEDIARDTDLKVRFDRHRGDGWQVYLPHAEPALRAALRIVAALKAQTGLSTRIAIGIGQAILPPDGDLGAASGEAFIGAGDMLDGMERNRNLAIDWRCGPFIPALVGLLDWQSQQWTAPQAEALFEALRSQTPTQEEIAGKFGVSRQAIQLRLAATGLSALREALAAYETHIEHVWETHR